MKRAAQFDCWRMRQAGSAFAKGVASSSTAAPSRSSAASAPSQSALHLVIELLVAEERAPGDALPLELEGLVEARERLGRG